MRKSIRHQINLAFAVVSLTGALAISNTHSSIAHAQDVTPVETQTPDVSPEAPKEVETKTGEVVEVPPTSVIEAPDSPAEVTDDSFFAALAAAIGGIKGQSTLAIVLVVAQLLIQFTKTNVFGKVFHRVDGNIKLLIVTGLTIATTMIPLIIQGMGWLAALTSGAAMSAIMVFGNQVYKQFVKDPKAQAAAQAAV